MTDTKLFYIVMLNAILFLIIIFIFCNTTLLDLFGDSSEDDESYYEFINSSNETVTGILTSSDDTGDLGILDIKDITDALNNINDKIDDVNSYYNSIENNVIWDTETTNGIAFIANKIVMGRQPAGGEVNIYMGEKNHPTYMSTWRADPEGTSPSKLIWLKPVLYAENLFMQASYMGDTKYYYNNCIDTLGLCGNTSKDYSNAYATGGAFVYSKGGGNTLGLGPNNKEVGSNGDGSGASLLVDDKPSVHYAFRFMKPPDGTAGYLTNSDGYGYINENTNKGGWNAGGT